MYRVISGSSVWTLMGAATLSLREVAILSLLLLCLVYSYSRDEWHIWPQRASPEPQSKTPSNHHAPTISRLSWTTHVPQTEIVAHVPGNPPLPSHLDKVISSISKGWTIFENLFIFKGVAYIVIDSPTRVPNVTSIYSKGFFIENGKEAVEARLPTDEDIRVISPKEARALFGSGANILDGVTVCVVLQ